MDFSPRAASSYCICEVGWLGGDCSIGGPNATAVGWFTTASGAKLIEFTTDANHFLHVRISFQATGYFGARSRRVACQRNDLHFKNKSI
jgi:hypothetical protein